MRIDRRLLLGAALAVGVLGAYACASVNMTGSSEPVPGDLSTQPSPAWRGGDTLRLTTWNLGYAGLGYRSDFFADGGKAYLPPSQTAVRESRDQIVQWLGDHPADVVLTQENARASAVNWWIDLKAGVDAALPDHGQAFYADFRTRLLPPPLRIRNGLATYVRSGLVRSELWDMPDDGDPYAGALRRRYAALATYVDGPGGCWVVVNVHTAAFDDKAALRRRQIQALIERAETERRAGRRVVMGGDWNLRLTPTDFPHTTGVEDLFWVHDFPRDILPEGWRIAADGSIPTVRTNERPYTAGENYTAVIDGFLLSPGIEMVSIQGADLGFRPSDHQPVRLTVRATGPDIPLCSRETETE